MPALMNEDDWIFEEDADGLSRYEGQGSDLALPIAQGQRLADLRSLCDITPSDLAERSEITLKELLAIEAGLLIMRPSLAFRLARELSVELSELQVKTDLT